MAKLNHSIKINVPQEKLWAILTDLEQVKNYNPMVKTVEIISETKSGVGAARCCQFTTKGSVKEKIKELEELTSIKMEVYESDWPLEYMRWTNALSENDGVTQLHTLTEYKIKFGLLGILLDNLFMKRKFNKILTDLFVSLKKYAEGM